jgi:hypothetical protein
MKKKLEKEADRKRRDWGTPVPIAEFAQNERLLATFISKRTGRSSTGSPTAAKENSS